MNPKRDKKFSSEHPNDRTSVRAADLLKQVELLAGIRKRIREGFYDRPEVLAQIALRIEQRLKD
jgi:hypothetical protein